MQKVTKFTKDQIRFEDEDLGSGMFGTVALASLMTPKWTKRIAVKIAHTNQRCGGTAENEISIMSKLNNPNIVRMIGVVEAADDDPWILMKYFRRGDLTHFFRDNFDHGVSESDRLQMTRDVAAGMKYLHCTHNIVHADLHSENCFVEDNGRIRIGDFGLSFVDLADNGEDEEEVCSKQLVIQSGRPSIPFASIPGFRFKAPEAIPGPEFTSKFLKSGDVWAYGILVFEIWTFLYPFEGLPDVEVLVLVARGQNPTTTECRPIEAPESIKNLMQSCFHFEPCRRPTFEQIDQSFLYTNGGILEFKFG